MTTSSDSSRQQNISNSKMMVFILLMLVQFRDRLELERKKLATVRSQQERCEIINGKNRPLQAWKSARRLIESHGKLTRNEQHECGGGHSTREKGGARHKNCNNCYAWHHRHDYGAMREICIMFIEN